MSAQSGAVFIADPPAGVRLATLLSRALSRALHSPLALPLEPLLSCAAADLQSVHQALLPASATTSGGCPAFIFCACRTQAVGGVHDGRAGNRVSELLPTLPSCPQSCLAMIAHNKLHFAMPNAILSDFQGCSLRCTGTGLSHPQRTRDGKWHVEMPIVCKILDGGPQEVWSCPDWLRLVNWAAPCSPATGSSCS